MTLAVGQLCMNTHTVTTLGHAIRKRLRCRALVSANEAVVCTTARCTCMCSWFLDRRGMSPPSYFAACAVSREPVSGDIARSQSHMHACVRKYVHLFSPVLKQPPHGASQHTLENLRRDDLFIHSCASLTLAQFQSLLIIPHTWRYKHTHQHVVLLYCPE